MFEPVSPSGTGKTLRSFTSCWLACSQDSALFRPPSTCIPPTARSGSRSTVTWTGAASRAGTVALEVDPLHVDVDGGDGEPEGLLQRVAHRAHEVVRHLADARAVLGDDVQLHHDAVLADAHLHAAAHALAVQPFGDAVAEPARRHADDAVALIGAVT